jgi:outer membrane protein assembly factor BamE (lipoprotein component of BamABCDE complex)
MRKYLLLVLIPVLAFAIGCGKPYFIGTPIEKSKMDQIVPGKTSESQLTQMFGQPTTKETLRTGETRYAYSYFEQHPRFWSKDVVYKSTLEIFAKNGVVQRYDFKREGVDSARAQ